MCCVSIKDYNRVWNQALRVATTARARVGLSSLFDFYCQLCDITRGTRVLTEDHIKVPPSDSQVADLLTDLHFVPQGAEAFSAPQIQAINKTLAGYYLSDKLWYHDGQGFVFTL